jgi:hypothetical protein
MRSSTSEFVRDLLVCISVLVIAFIICIAFDPRTQEDLEFSEGLAPVICHGKFCYVDRHYIIVIAPLFDYAGPFHGEVALVAIEDRYGFIDTAGKYIAEPKFDSAWDFCEGIARVQVGSKYGYIDKTGSYVVSPCYDLAEDFSGGLAHVKVTGERQAW